MRNNRLLRFGVTLITALGFAAPAVAEVRSEVLRVAMTCPASDPPVIESVLLHMAGVKTVEVAYDDQTVTVTFDNALGSIEDLIAALDEFGLEAESAMDGMPDTPPDNAK